MIKKLFSIFALAVLFSLTSQKALASHVSGGEVTYTSLGGMQYKITLVLYWDCSAFDPGISQSMGTTNSCGLADQTFTVNLDTAYEISQLCPSSMLNSTCNGGTLPGNKKNQYSGIITLPGGCADWTFFVTSCCRNNSTNVPLNPSWTFYATLNNILAPLNNSPYFTSQPLPYLCVGQQVCYSPGTVEIDGNTLSFSFIDAANTSATVPVGYAGGYTGAVPMPGITINAGNGLMLFTPTMIGNFVVTFQVTETNASGQVIGTVERDVEMVVVNCTNAVVPCNSGPITAVTGTGAVILPPNMIQVCENIPFTFQFSFTDPDPLDVLSITSNIGAVLPGSIITVTGTNPITVNVAWTAPAGTANTFTTFAVTVSDNACPVTGQQTVNYIMDILPATYAGQDVTICGSQADTLVGSGPGATFTWSVISGPPMVTSGAGQNFSCATCQTAIATPTATTTYLLTCAGGVGCIIYDTVTVNVVNNFTYSVTQSSPTSCLMDPVQLNVTNVIPGPATAYTYAWAPATNLSNPSIANPVATFNVPGNYNYSVTVTSPNGCVYTSNVAIAVAPVFAPDIIASVDTSFCPGGIAPLNADFTGGSLPPTCGLSPTGGCGGASLVGTLGTGLTSNTDYSYPAPFGNWYTSVTQQYLYTAAELNAAGIVGGKIDQIDWNVTLMNTAGGAITTYPEFTIRMGCTALTSFGAAPTYVPGLPVVFPAATVTATLGWNTFLFTNAYEWDGLSNVIVEVCFANGPPWPNYTYNLQSTQTATGYVSSQWWLSDTQDQCGGPTGFGSTASIHPDMKMHFCSIISNPLDFTYQWTSYPAGQYIANDTMQYTSGQPTVITDYVVTVTNINGGCTGSDTVTVGVINISTMAITPAGPYCVASPLDTLQVSVPVGTGLFSGTGIIDPILGTFDPATAGVGFHQIIYTVSSSLCGTGADTIIISVQNQLDPTINYVGGVCTSWAPFNMTAATAGGTWSGNGITNALTGTFDPTMASSLGSDTITYTILLPCFSQDTAVVTVVTQMDATINPVLPVCVDAASFNMTAVTIGGLWSGTGITNSVAGTFNPGVAGPGVHVISHYFPQFCGDTATTTVTVSALPIITAVPDVTSGCEPLTVNFASTNDQPGGTSFWDFGDGHTSVMTNPTETYVSYNGGIPYNVTFTYTNLIGCVSTIVQTGLITVYSQPVAIFTATPQPTDITRPEIQFTDLSTGVIDTWLWSFGTGATSSLQNPTFTYADSGHYNVQLIVSNVNGCVDTSNHIIAIDPILTCYIPTAFTPNGNGNNDVFVVHGENIQTIGFEMLIFDRWGEKIFQSTDLTKGWNGKLNNSGTLLEQAVYVYKIHLMDWKGLDHDYIGHITLLR